MISPPGSGDPYEFVQGRLRIRHRGDDVLRDHDVEAGVRKSKMLRVHHCQRFDMGELVLDHAFMRLAQHRLGIVHADDAVGGLVVGERDAGADADVEDATANSLRRGNRRLAAGIEHGAEDEVVDRRPARIRLGDRADVDFVCHVCPSSLAATLTRKAGNAGPCSVTKGYPVIRSAPQGPLRRRRSARPPPLRSG